jgi:uncharacterized membrane protein
MEDQSNRGPDYLLMTLLVVSIVLVVIGLAWASVTNETMMGGMMGHDSQPSGFPMGTSVFLIGVLFVIVTTILVAVGRRRGPPVMQPQPMMPHYYPQPEGKATGVTEEDMHKLTIRLLGGDERKMFRRIVEGDGAVLQKDLVAEGMFSKSKVTRLLDKLEERGLIVRERYGATNRIRISEDLGK